MGRELDIRAMEEGWKEKKRKEEGGKLNGEFSL